jgi:hypothetical protein
MAKGFFTQGVCLLTDGQITLDSILAVIGREFPIAKQTPPAEQWQFRGPAAVIPFRPEVNGYVAVDVVGHRWPDQMGDPKTDPDTFAAWSLGQFGPLTFPGGLERAGQHAMLWNDGRTIAESHRGFVRIRLSYAFGAQGDDPVYPKDSDPVAELQFIGRLVLAVFEVQGVLCYFNPNGEVLLNQDVFCDVWTWSEREDILPLPLWTNVRFFSLSDEFGLMDTVGNGQLDVQDVEGIFPKGEYDPNEIAKHVQNVSHYLLESELPVRSGDAIDGPNETNLSWTLELLENGLIRPPRRVVRLYPKAHSRTIQAAISATGVSQV